MAEPFVATGWSSTVDESAMTTKSPLGRPHGREHSSELTSTLSSAGKLALAMTRASKPLAISERGVVPSRRPIPSLAMMNSNPLSSSNGANKLIAHDLSDKSSSLKSDSTLQHPRASHESHLHSMVGTTNPRLITSREREVAGLGRQSSRDSSSTILRRAAAAESQSTVGAGGSLNDGASRFRSSLSSSSSSSSSASQIHDGGSTLRSQSKILHNTSEYSLNTSLMTPSTSTSSLGSPSSSTSHHLSSSSSAAKLHLQNESGLIRNVTKAYFNSLLGSTPRNAATDTGLSASSSSASSASSASHRSSTGMSTSAATTTAAAAAEAAAAAGSLVPSNRLSMHQARSSVKGALLPPSTLSTSSSFSSQQQIDAYKSIEATMALFQLTLSKYQLPPTHAASSTFSSVSGSSTSASASIFRSSHAHQDTYPDQDYGPSDEREGRGSTADSSFFPLTVSRLAYPPTPRHSGPHRAHCHALHMYPEPLARFRLIHFPWLRPVSAMHLAAVRLQRWFRSIRARRRLATLVKYVLAEPQSKYFTQKLRVLHAAETLRDSRLPHASAATAAAAAAALSSSSSSSSSLPSASASSIRDRPGIIASIQQRAFRPRHDDNRKIAVSHGPVHPSRLADFSNHRMYAVAAEVIQRAWRAAQVAMAHKAMTVPLLLRLRAVRAIQRAWRSYADRKVFKYFKNVVIGRTLTDPVAILKVICPSESHLSDAASGLYVRFRLGGPLFPPMLFYKVFTARPVTDIGAFAPRNYHARQTQEALRPSRVHIISQDRREKGTDGRVTVDESAANEWYRRFDNNNWRAVSGESIAVIAGVASFRRAMGSVNSTSSVSAVFGRGGGGAGVNDGDLLRHPYAEAMDALMMRHPGSGGGMSLWEDGGWGPGNQQHPAAALAAGPHFKQPEHHPVKLVRQVDAIKRRKREKLQWLQKLYANACTRTVPSEGDVDGDVDAVNHSEGETKSGVATGRTGGERRQVVPMSLAGALTLGADPQNDAVVTPDFWRELANAAVDDDTLAWAAQLDHESYLRDWACVGTTRPAEEALPFDQEDVRIRQEKERLKNAPVYVPQHLKPSVYSGDTASAAQAALEESSLLSGLQTGGAPGMPSPLAPTPLYHQQQQQLQQLQQQQQAGDLWKRSKRRPGSRAASRLGDDVDRSYYDDEDSSISATSLSTSSLY